MKNYINTLKRISLFRWVLSFLILLGLAVSSCEYALQALSKNPNFFEIILSQTDESNMVCFIMTYAFLLLAGDFYVSGEGIIKKYDLIKKIKQPLLIIISFMVIFLLANFFACVFTLDIRALFLNVWTYGGELKQSGMSPLSAAGISLLLVSLRFISMGMLILFINALIKNKIWGGITVLFVSVIDWWYYLIANIQKTAFFLPMAHTKITFYGPVRPPLPEDIRGPFFYSVLYWTAAIFLIYALLILVVQIRRKRYADNIQ